MKRTIITGAVLALAVAGMDVSQAGQPTGFKVTGGGQIIADRNGGGPGDTIALTARNINGADGSRDRDTAAGQVQFIDRVEGEGGRGDKVHGTVTCLEVTGRTARVGGTTSDGGFFRIDLMDSGEQGTDLIKYAKRTSAFNCNDDNQDAAQEDRLSRGNVRIHAAE